MRSPGQKTSEPRPLPSVSAGAPRGSLCFEKFRRGARRGPALGVVRPDADDEGTPLGTSHSPARRRRAGGWRNGHARQQALRAARSPGVRRRPAREHVRGGDGRVAEATLAAAWDAGIRYFDTAPHYGPGISEHRFGHALRGRPRDDFVLSTKVGRLLRADASKGGKHGPFVQGLPFRVDYDYTADGARRSIEDSLQRLGMARIDVAFIHDCAEDAHGERWPEVLDTAMKGAAAALTRLREEGVIRGWGLGVNRVEPCVLALK